MGLLNQINTINQTLTTNNQKALSEKEKMRHQKEKEIKIKNIMLENFTSYFGALTIEKILK